MTITRIPTAHQQHIFSFLDERDLHFAGRSCKTLQKAAGDNRLWKPFLAKRSIEPTENNKQRLTAYFKQCCECVAEIRESLRRDDASDRLKKQKWQQLLMDGDNQPGDIVIPRARWNEIHYSKFIDLYDQFSAIFNTAINSKILRGQLHDEDLRFRTADPDRVRFFLEIDRNSPNFWDKGNVLNQKLENAECPLETVKLLLASKAGFSENRSSGNQYLKGTIDTAARHSSREVFLFLWNLHPKISPTLPPHEGTLGSAVQNPLLAKDPDVIKILLAAGAQPDDRYSYDEDVDNGHITGTLNLALYYNCTYDTAQALLQAGAYPTQRETRNSERHAGSLDAAVIGKCSEDILQLLLKNGATLSRAENRDTWSGRYRWPGTLEYAKQNNLPPGSIQLLEEAAR